MHNARTFVFSTAPLPAILHAAVQAAIDLVKIMQPDRERLWQTADTIRRAAGSQPIPQTYRTSCRSSAKAKRLRWRYRRNLPPRVFMRARSGRPP
jgi:7-keto-8-aminopelargonate synthetase-like enzyme